MKIDPRHLSLVRAIVDYGTFNRAAEALGMSQPALSKSIALLERRLGVKVFDRGARGATVTEAGEIIARNAKNLEQILNRTQQEINAKGSLVEGPIVVGATPSMMPSVVPEVVSRLSGPHSKHSITLLEGLDDTLKPDLECGKVDFIIGPVDSLHPPAQGISETKMLEERFSIGIAANHAFANRDEVRLEDLADEPWVLPTPGSSFYRAAEGLFTAAGMAWPRDTISTNCLAAHEGLVAAGRIGIVTAVQEYKRDHRLRIVPISGSPMRAIGVRRLEGVRLSPLANRFIEVLQDVFGEIAESVSIGLSTGAALSEERGRC